jgi:hypothetical protein
MNRILLALLGTALLCGNLPAQTTAQPEPAPTANPASASPVPKLASGSVIPVQLTKSVDAKKVKTGDEVVAKVTQDMRNNAGTIIVAKDTRILGHVTEAQARNKEQKESEVAIAFDHVVPKNGEAMEIPMSIQAIIAPQNPNSANASASQQSPSTSVPDNSGSPNGRQGMGGTTAGTTPQPPSVSQDSGTQAGATAGNQAQQPITGNTRGVVGMSNLNLAAAPDPTQGSVVSSEKNNVRLDDGIFLLLRVN